MTTEALPTKKQRALAAEVIREMDLLEAANGPCHGTEDALDSLRLEMRALERSPKLGARSCALALAAKALWLAAGLDGQL